MADTREVIRTDIEMNARAALEQLREMSRDASNAEEAVAKFSSFLLTNSKKWQVPVKQLREEFKALNAELAKSKQQTLFGNFGNKKIFGMEEQFTASAQAAGRFQVAQNGVVTSINRGNKALDEADRAARGYGAGINLVRTALGTLAAVGIFTILNAIQEAFSTASKNAQELEASLYRLKNSERILSEQGIEISFKGMEDGIKRIKKLVPVFSKEDIAGLVGQLSISTQSLGLTEKQIIDLAESIAVLNINSAENETLQQTASKVVSSLLTSNAKGVANLGIKLGDAAIQAKAFEMGLLDAGESVSKLTAHEKDMVKVAIAIETGQESVAGLNDFLATNTARVQQNKAAWNDLLTTVGQLFLPFIPLLTKFFSLLNDGFNMVKSGMVVLLTVGTTVLTFFRMFAGKGIHSFKELKEAITEIDDAAKKMIANLFFPEGIPDNAPEWFKKFFGDALTPKETPTGVGGGSDATEEEGRKQADALKESEDKIQEIMQDARDKREQIDEDYRRKIEDANRDHAEKMEDIARDVARKQEDALRNYNEKVEDINRDANEKIAEAQADAQQKELDREAEFQNKLRELRERFLFDLEDALRERDARQVLRLIREYNFDKKNLEEKHKLERQDAKKDLAEKLADIERERQLKLEAAKRELAEKQAEIKIWQDREIADAQRALSRKLEDARRWHERELAENRQFLQRKLQDLAQAIAQEYQLTAAGAAAIQSLLNGYMGTGGIGSLGGVSSGGTTSGGFTTFSPNGTPTYNPYDVRARFAEGGSFVATRPSKLLVAENQPEMVTVSPIGRVGNNQNKVFGDIGGGQQNSLDLRIQLAEGLVAEIVDSSLDSVAAHIEKINREK